LSVEENIGFLTDVKSRAGFVSRGRTRKFALETLKLLGQEEINPAALVQDIRLADAWFVMLSAALSTQPKLLVLDESTAALSQADATSLFEALRQRIDEGLAVVLVSHRMGDVRALADQITILREGKIAGSLLPTASTDEIVRVMFGAGAIAAEQRAHLKALEAGPDSGRAQPLFEANRISTERIRDIDLKLMPGQILGIAGGLGSGRSEIVRVIGGVKKATGGSMTLHGDPYCPGSPRQAISRGIVTLPEDRDVNGILPGLSIAKNSTISSIFKFQRGKTPLLNLRAEGKEVDAIIERFSVKGNREQEVMTLSGGNRQKVLLGRASLTDASVILLDDPTSGLDIASRIDMANSIAEFVSHGGAAVIVSDEFDELLRVCTDLIVVNDGRLVNEMKVTTRLTEEDVASAAYAGGKSE
jgi:ribose transport system ATP-binding protein